MIHTYTQARGVRARGLTGAKIIGGGGPFLKTERGNRLKAHQKRGRGGGGGWVGGGGRVRGVGGGKGG